MEMSSSTSAFLTCLVLFPTISTAQEDLGNVSQVIESYSSARLEEPVKPYYPAGARREGREGWVILNYMISPEGAIVDSMIEDSSGGKDFERAALKMLARWKYEPAMLNGVPVAQSVTKYRVVFRLEDSPRGAGRQFRHAFRKIQGLITDQELDLAKELLTDLLQTEKRNLYEDAWSWWLNYQWLAAVGDDNTDEQLSSLRRAIGYEEVYLPPDIFVFALQKRYVLLLQDSDIGGAVHTFERLQNSKEAKRSEYYEKVLGAVEPSFTEIQNLLASEQTLSLGARIGKNGYWSHQLLRRSFELGDVSGALEIVDVRCPRRNGQYPASENITWTIPASWGNCVVIVKGDEGTTFSIYEFSDMPAAAQ